MATSKKTETTTSTTAGTEKSASESMAQDAIDRVKDAVPSMEGVANDVQDYIQGNLNTDLQKMADDASEFVRRNPAASLAAAAGVGILLGILATKRS